MSKSTIILIAVVGVIGLFAMSMVGMYNGLVTDNEKVNGKWSQVENNLQRRADLIPNLVNSVKGFAAQEKAVIDSVTNARAKLASSQTPATKAEANGELSGALSRLLMVVENYPQIKSDKLFKQVMDELAGTENRLAVARKDYNDAVQPFNAKIKSFPTSLMAGFGGFTAREYFKVEESAKAVPKVQF